MRIPLSSAADWELVDRNQDIRGWRVEGPSGEQLGHVTELLIDTELEHIDELILDTGTRIYPEDVTLGDGVVTLLPDARVRPGAAGARAMGVSRVGEPTDADLDGTAPGKTSPEGEPAQATVPAWDAEPTAELETASEFQAAHDLEPEREPIAAAEPGAPEADGYEVRPEPEPVAILETASPDTPDAPASPPAPLADPPFADALEPPPPINLAGLPEPAPVAAAAGDPEVVSLLPGQIEVEKRVIEERHNVEVLVSRDRVVVRRLVVDRPADGTEQPYWEGDEYHIPVLAERIEIRRVLRVVEELVVTRGQIQDTEHIDESVRREAITIRERRDEPAGP